jgi:nucleoside phosphorylase
MDPAEFTAGWICALPLELTAAQGMCEEEYDDRELRKHPRDTNKYCLGQIAGHKVVLTCLISAGTNQAGSAAHHMQNTFENLRFILMVGIGGGIPSTGHDVRLGDVVVSMPSGEYGGVVQYDSGKFLQDEDFKRTGALKAPPQHLRKVVNFLIARHESQENCIARHIQEMLQKNPKNTRAGTDFRRPGTGHDLLFKAKYVHKGNGDTCVDCDKKQLITRPDRDVDEPVMHYGNIASGSSVVRDALKRDQLGKEYGALCVEMEAAGLMDVLDCLVIRGICDYSDSHKNKDWQRYAAAAAASYAKELLGAVSRPKVEGMSLAPDSIAPDSITFEFYLTP